MAVLLIALLASFVKYYQNQDNVGLEINLHTHKPDIYLKTDIFSILPFKNTVNIRVSWRKRLKELELGLQISANNSFLWKQNITETK